MFTKDCYSDKVIMYWVGQIIVAAIGESTQVRKVRASQGRMPDNIW